MARKNDQTNSQFDTGFGAGGTFGGTSGGGSPKSQAQMGGEFSSGFGGGTNAVSQIFQGNGSGGEDKRKKMMTALLLGIGLAGLGYVAYDFYVQDQMSSEEPITAVTPAAQPTAQADAATTKAATAVDEEVAAGEDDAVEDDAEGEEADELAVDTVAPSSSGSYTYNEIGGGPIVQAAAGTAIEVSRKSDFSEMYMTGTTNAGGQLRIPNPPPGKVYWRVAGKTEVTEIVIAAAPMLNIAMKLGASIGANDTLQWSADGNVAHYRLEFASDASFANVAHSFSTKANQLALSGVNPGNYFVRVGGLNVAAGRWEFTRGSAVEVK